VTAFVAFVMVGAVAVLAGNSHSAAVLAQSQSQAIAQPMIAIIIADLGNLRGEGLRALELPGPITYAVLPHTPHARELAELAYALGKEVMLHLPMEARSGKALGPGGVKQTLSRNKLRETVLAALDSIPQVAGLSNHMGSLLTSMPDRMDWLMESLQARPSLYFIDSRTHPQSVAYDSARRSGVIAGQRDVFLDHHRSPARINHELDRLIVIAREKGKAIGIGHPYPETMAVLRRRLPELTAAGIRFVPVSEVVDEHLKQARID
jgi:polysaccharide deacetylase 2 family uncharacterized protein YibQ